MMDAVVFAKGVILGSAAAEIVIVYLYRFENYSRSVFVIDAALLVLLLSGTRASFRLIAEFLLRRTAVGRRCIIYGTGGASMATIREAFGGDAPLKIVGYIDDDPRQRNSRVAGYSVIGGYGELLDLLAREEVDSVVLNAHLMDAARLQQLEAACRDQGVDLLELDVRLTPFSAASVA
jgi:UDP-GlcNAc:undecaprenyl-phosphate GlcNAc-1-phosphate transferase